MNEVLAAALEIMWKGMAGIFTVMILLIICVKLLTKFTKDRDKQ